jgi:gliding motility-associated-like protein
VLPRAPADMTISDTIVCPNELVTFTANVDPIYTRYIWNFGDGDTANRFFPDSTVNHGYKLSGVYDVKLIPDFTPPPFTPKCVDTAYGRVTVVDVVADFSIDTVKRPEFCFTNLSTGAASYEWIFEDDPADGTSTETDPCYNWNDRLGTWEVCLIATSAEGCKDTFCDEVRNVFFRRIIPYNVFTPGSDNDGDGLNDVFKITGEGLTEYNIKIFNRWGERVFESESIDVSWNGQINNSGALVPEGTYFYIINYTFLFGEKNEGLDPIEGTVDVIRQ